MVLHVFPNVYGVERRATPEARQSDCARERAAAQFDPRNGVARRERAKRFEQYFSDQGMSFRREYGFFAVDEEIALLAGGEKNAFALERARPQ
jgi:hypothetical protein